VKITKNRLQQIIKEEIEAISDEDVLGVSDRVADQVTPEQRLLNMLATRARLDKMSDNELEALAGGDEDVMELIKSILDNPMLDKSRM
jgi:hypothetical protein